MKQEEITPHVLSMLGDLKAVCNDCGECCKNEQIILTDTEAPFIARGLNEIGGQALVKKHVFYNRRPFNINERFELRFTDGCPFREDACTIKKARPMTCMLYPLSLAALVDNPKLELRQAFFTVPGPKEEYGCRGKTDSLTAKLNALGRDSPMNLTEAQTMIASALLDLPSLAYCFGQLRERGERRFTPTQTGIFYSTIEIQEHLFHRYVAMLGDSIPLDTIYQPLSPEINSQLLSDNAISRAKTKISKRLGNITKYAPHVRQWHNEMSLLLV